MGARDPDGPKPEKPASKKRARRAASCQLEMGRGRSRVLRRGVAALEKDELRFHTGRTGRAGKDFSLRLGYEEIRGLELDAPKGLLTIVRDEDRLIFHLGRLAADWKQMIEDRPSTAELFQLRPDSRVLVLGVDDDELGPILPPSSDGAGLDLAFVGIAHRADLARVADAARRLRQGGVVWAVTPPRARLPREELVAAARAAGLIDAQTIGLETGAEALALRKPT